MIFSIIFLTTISKIFLTYAARTQNDYNCYDFQYNPRVCLPGPIDIAKNNEITVNPKYTCGTPSSKYCRVAEPSGCFVCNSSSSANNHPVQHMTDKDYPLNYWNSRLKPTWWQSITWWDAKQKLLLTDNTLKINLTLSMNKSYDLTGSFQVTFYSSKPHAFVFERSSDFGKTWKPYRYYADKCSVRFPDVKILSESNTQREAFCVQHQSLAAVQGSVVKFEPSFTRDNFWTNETQKYLIATDFRLSLQYPWTDNNERINQESFLNKYYYDITDIEIHGRCHCNGHAPYCDSKKQCFCQHNTAGVDCERCLPLFNNKPWKPAEASNKPNPCGACHCNQHSESCHYNATLGHGICNSCEDGTAGMFCDICDLFNYRNSSLPISDKNACIACDCFLPGTLNNGECFKNNSVTHEVGQCPCKANVHGRKCDECEGGFYGLRLLNRSCLSCNCSVNGTITGQMSCDQITGQCKCKPTVSGINCSKCKPGYFNFPKNIGHECETCSCDPGGSVDFSCNQINGSCSCQTGIIGTLCNQVSHGMFVPSFNHYIFEAEHANGDYERMPEESKHNKEFTGLGYASLNRTNSISFKFSPEFTAMFYIQLRYKAANFIQNITFEIRYTNNTVNFPMVPTTQSSLLESTNHQTMSSAVFHENGNYSIGITNAGSHSLLIDSIVLLPNYKESVVYSNSSVQRDIATCWNESAISYTLDVLEKCQSIVFSSTAKWFNGAKDCGCNLIGSMNSTCNKHGGQCYCKDGVIGRQCDQCMAGHFNLTNNGCQKCNCDKQGSNGFVCSKETGQCLCKENIDTRTCNKCKYNYYGFGTVQGCQSCGCDGNGSSSLQCLKSGACICKDSTQGEKCDQCQVNYYNFTQNGCSSCGCDAKGSQALQCDQHNGDCQCKQNVEGKRCSSCKPGFFNLNNGNTDGCTRCFCYNQTNECLSASGYTLKPVPKNLFQWSEVNIGNFETTKEKISFNVSGNTFILSTPSNYLGNRLHLMDRGLTVEFSIKYKNLDVAGNRSITVLFIGKNGDQVMVTLANITNGVVHKKLVRLNEEMTGVKSWKLQSILLDVSTIRVIFSGVRGDVGNFYNLEMFDLIDGGGGGSFFGGVELCRCPQNFTGSSCQQCATGYTRLNEVADSWNSCVLCSCNGRANECNPQTGICRECQHGTEGDHCERCQVNVQEPDCDRCTPGYYGYNDNSFVGCKACDCIAVNTVNNRSDICDANTGQCPCKEDIGGRICDRCAENAVNISDACTACSLCHELLQDEVHIMREQILLFQRTIQNASRAAHLITDRSFPQLLANLSVSVLRIMAQVNSSSQLEQDLHQEFQNMGEVLFRLQLILRDNISLAVNTARAQSASFVSFGNQTRDTMATIYDFLWMSVYVINADVAPRSNKSILLLRRLQEAADNFTVIAKQRITSYAPVLLNVEQLFNSSNFIIAQTSQLVNITSPDVNQTLLDIKAELEDIDEALVAQKVLSGNLYNQSLEMTVFSNFFLMKVSNHSMKIQTDLDVNSTQSVIQDLSTTNATLHNDLIALQSRLRVAQQSYNDIFNVSKIFLNRSSSAIRRVNSTVESSHQIYQNVQQIYDGMMKNATLVVNHTFNTAQKMLGILSDYQTAITNSSKSLKNSMDQLTQLNKSSTETIHNVTKMKEEILRIFQNFSQILNQSSNLKSEADQQRQVVLNILSTYNDLARKPVLRINMSELHAMFRTINNLGYEGYALKIRCNGSQNISKQASDSFRWASEAKTDQSRQAADINILMDEIQNIKTLNTTQIGDLQIKVKQAQDTFDRNKLTHALSTLRNARDEQKEKLEAQRKSVSELKKELKLLRDLYDQMKRTSGCLLG